MRVGHTCIILRWYTATVPLIMVPARGVAAAAANAVRPTTTTSGRPSTKRRPLRGVVFDMDGTLTVPNLDFDDMYRRCSVPRDQDIFAVLAQRSQPERQAAFDVIHDLEAQARQTLQLMPGADVAAAWCQQQNLPLALVTRNTESTVQHFCQHLFPAYAFDVTITRDDHHATAAVPPKPHPAALHHIAAKWQTTADCLVMVGDSLENDVGCGVHAGAATVLLQSAAAGDQDRRSIGNAATPPLQPDFVIRSLLELPSVIQDNFTWE